MLDDAWFHDYGTRAIDLVANELCIFVALYLIAIL